MRTVGDLRQVNGTGRTARCDRFDLIRRGYEKSPTRRYCVFVTAAGSTKPIATLEHFSTVGIDDMAIDVSKLPFDVTSFE